VIFQGVSVALPAGWRVARPRCGSPANDTVVRGWWTGSCPAGFRERRTTAVTLTALYGRQFALAWPGHRTTWHGQPAWLHVTRRHGLSTTTLSLPWLNVVVAAQSGDPSVPEKLLARVTPHAQNGLVVPAHASAIFIQSLAGRDGDHQRRNTRITEPASMRRILSDLRHLPSVTSPQQACGRSWWPRTAVLTVRHNSEARTYAAHFGNCSLVLAGTGSAGRSTHRLYSDIKRLVPNSNL
jgi:hypothetical protein